MESTEKKKIWRLQDFSRTPYSVFDDDVSDDEIYQGYRGFEKNIDCLLRLQLFESKVQDDLAGEAQQSEDLNP